MASDGRKKEQEAARIQEILERLDEHYPDAHCALDHENPYQLLVATILSAQCTDVRVNLVTPELFKRYPTPSDLVGAEQEELQEVIRSTGFFRNKAKNLVGAAQKITSDHDGEVPQEMEDLLKLPGVARKTANVVRGTAFGKADGVVVDTHVKRISNRLGLTPHSDPIRVEKDLMNKIPREQWIDFAHQLIHHGRTLCQARKPRCSECFLLDLCPYGQEAA